MAKPRLQIGSRKTTIENRLKTIAMSDFDGNHVDTDQFGNWVLAIAIKPAQYQSGSTLSRGRVVIASPDLVRWFDPDLGVVNAVDADHLEELEE